MTSRQKPAEHREDPCKQTIRKTINDLVQVAIVIFVGIGLDQFIQHFAVTKSAGLYEAISTGSTFLFLIIIGIAGLDLVGCFMERIQHRIEDGRRLWNAIKRQNEAKGKHSR